MSRLLSWCLVVVAQVASTAGYALSQIVEANRELSLLVAGTVQQMVLRPKTSPRGKYYAVVFLNQLVLSKATSELANQLMRIYFALFEASVEVWPLSLCAVLRVGCTVERRQTAVAAAVVGVASDGLVAWCVCTCAAAQVDTGKSKILAALLTGVNRAFPYSSLDKDFMTARVNALFRLVHTSSFNTSIQALRLLHQVRVPPAQICGGRGVW